MIVKFFFHGQSFLVSGKNCTGNNGPGKNGTPGKIGKSGTFSTLSLRVGV